MFEEQQQDQCAFNEGEVVRMLGDDGRELE